MVRPRFLPPTVRSRRLGKELRRLREVGGLTGDEAAKRLRCSISRISRIEAGEIRVRPGDVYEFLEIYPASEEERNALLDMAREFKQEGWWQRFDDVLSKRYLTYISMESEASTVRNFEPTVIPGLLQTDEYARAVVRIGIDQPKDREETDRKVEARMARQAMLTADRPLALWVIVDEAVIRRPIGGERVMKEQLQHLVEVAEMPNVTFQMLPFARGAFPSLAGAFHILEFPDPADRDVAYTDTMLGDLYVESEEEIGRLSKVFARLQAIALSPEESATLTSQVAGRL